MKKLSLLLCVLMILTFALSYGVSASGNAKLVISERHDEVALGDKVTVKIALSDIHDDAGVVMVDYSLCYDNEILKISSFENTVPESWASDSENYEDWTAEATKKDEDGNSIAQILKVTVMNSFMGSGVKADDEIYTTVKFEVIKVPENGKTEIKLENIDICNDNLDKIEVDEASLNIDLSNASVNTDDEKTSDGGIQPWQIILISVTVLFVIAAGVVIFFVTSKKNKSKSENKQND